MKQALWQVMRYILISAWHGQNEINANMYKTFHFQLLPNMRTYIGNLIIDDI